MVRRDLLFFILSMVIISAPFTGAEMVTTVTVSDYLIASRFFDDPLTPVNEGMIGILNLLKTSLDIKSRGNNSVKAQFQLDALVADRITVDIPRAYVKVRFPGFRTTLGKTRLSWGEGFMFNAGDVIFGGMSLDVDITQSVLRDSTDVLASVYIPLGRFSYIETIFLPFSVLAEISPGLLVPVPGNFADVSAGGRISGELFNITFESGYLYQGTTQIHKPYIAAHGALLIDWYIAASCEIPQEDPDEDDFKDSFAVSCGFYNIISLEGDASLNLRFEAGIYPFGEWEEADGPAAKPYGIYVFPEIVYTPNQTMSFEIRSLISPVDLSGIIFTSMNWNMYQGFNLGFMASAMFGDEDDPLFGWERDGDLAFVLSLEYVYGE